jgi:tetratricopeptide (TPR) repeat protein
MRRTYPTGLFRPGLLAAGLAVALAAPAARGRDEDALKAELLKLNSLKGEEAELKALRALIKDREKAKKAVALGTKLQKGAKDGDKPFNFAGAYVLGRAAHAVKDYDAAEYLLEYCAETATKAERGEQMIRAYDGLVDLYFDQKKYQDAVDVCERVAELKGPAEIENVQPFFLERLVQAKARQGKTDEAMGITAGLIKLSDESWYFVKLKAWVQREAGKYDDAIETYLSVLDKLEKARRMPAADRERFTNRVRYELSSVYVDNKDIDKAAKQLQILIKNDPDNPTYKNDLGFIWADHDMNLEESEKLIREALDLDRKRQEKLKAEGKIDEVTETPAYVDSMGWVLFKQKKYKEALPWLKKAAEDPDEGNHLEIWDHLADCYLALGEKKEAIAAWQKGLGFDDISRRDVERRKKVIEKLKAAGGEVPEKKAPPRKRD